MREDNRVNIALRVLLGILGVSGATVGAWAAFAPRSFYDDFPGFGQIWVAVDGPYNEHLVRDVGALNLALVAVTVCAFVMLSRATILATALAWLAYGIPHVVYHARHLDVFDGAEAVAVIGGVASTSVVAVVLLWLERSRVARV
jgi:hypothetical protein